MTGKVIRNANVRLTKHQNDFNFECRGAWLQVVVCVVSQSNTPPPHLYYHTMYIEATFDKIRINDLSLFQ